MKTVELLSQLRTLGVQISVDGERLKLNAPKGVLTPAIQANLSAHKAEILTFLQAAQRGPTTNIPTLDRSQILPLSLGQERLWALVRMEPDVPAYNMYLSFEVRGNLDVSALERTISMLLARHEILRTSYPAINGVPQLRIAPAAPVNMPITDLRSREDIPEIAQQRQLQTILAPFDLEHGPLLRTALVQLADTDWLLTLVMHHIIADGWSWAVFLRELGLGYTAVLNGTSADFPMLALQYVDIAAWQRQQIAEGRSEAIRSYWNERLRGLTDRMALPPDRVHSLMRHQGRRTSRIIPPELTRALRGVGQRAGATLYCTLLAIWSATLAAATGDDEVVLCTPMASRRLIESQSLLGYFNTIVPLRLDIRGELHLQALVRRVQLTVQAAYEHQEILYEQLAVISESVRHALTHHVFVVQDTSGQTLRLANTEVTRVPIYTGHASFDCFVTIEDCGESLTITAEYKANRYHEATIEALLNAYIDALQQATQHSEGVLHPTDWRSAVASIQQPVASTRVAPRSPLEAEVLGIWARILGTQDVGVTDNFFDMGGDSLLALRLVTRIEEQLGSNLPLAALIHEPTAANVARLIEHGQHTDLWRPLVAIQPHGSKPPFFAVHGVHGNILFWRDMATYLGPDQPFYALQSRGIDGFQEPLRSIPAMARWYIEEIRSIQPHGPYYLGGYSLGGEIAFEMAQQLLASGETVAFLVLFDTMNPDRPVYRVALAAQTNSATQTVPHEHQLPVIRRKIEGHLQRLAGKEPLQMLRYVYADARMRVQRALRRRKIISYHRQKRRLDPDLLLWHLEEYHTAALQAYVPAIYPGRLTLFRTRESLANNPLGSVYGWEALTAIECDLHLFDSPHRMVDAAYIGQVVTTLQLCLTKARAEANTAVSST